MNKFYFMGMILLGFNLNAQVLSDGEFYIKSKHSGLCMKSNATNHMLDISILEQSNCEDLENQKFKLTHIENDNYIISNIAVVDKMSQNGDVIYSGEVLGNATEFKINKVDENSYSIQSLISSKYITAKPYTNKIIQYYGHLNKEQLWSISDSYEEPSNNGISLEDLIANADNSGDIGYGIGGYSFGTLWLDSEKVHGTHHYASENSNTIIILITESNHVIAYSNFRDNSWTYGASNGPDKFFINGEEINLNGNILKRVTEVLGSDATIDYDWKDGKSISLKIIGKYYKINNPSITLDDLYKN